MNAVAHIDANYFYAQVEALYRPDLRGKAFVVGGDQESRRGIVLTKSPLAKKIGIKTGVSIRDALNVYPKRIIVPANYPLYLHFSKRMREIVLQHTDVIRPFGSDEMWAQLYGDRAKVRKTIDEIRRDVWKQLCLTVSVGVGESMPYAKIGSDLRKPDATTVIPERGFQEIVWPLPETTHSHKEQSHTRCEILSYAI